MRKARIAAATAIAVAGLTGGVVTSASAAPPLNYGHCVSGGTVSPSGDDTGPGNENAAVFPSAATHAFLTSDLNSRFPASAECIK